MERRKDPRKPIRLKVTFRSAESLVTEYTTCVSKGGCALVTERAIERGTKFVFEMYVQGNDEPLEVEGQVVRVHPIEGTARFEIGVQYLTAGPQRDVLDSLLSNILVDPNYELRRRHPRIPVNLIAHDRNPQVRYLVRDVSRGGMRIEGRAIAPGIDVGSPCELRVLIGRQQGPFLIRGKAAWVHRGTRSIRTRLGIQFAELDDPGMMVVDGMTRLLRPQRLDLELGTSADRPEPSIRRASNLTAPRTARQASELIKAIAVEFLVELPGLQLSLLELLQLTESAHTDVVRVGIVGDVDSEIVIETSLELGARIASQTVGEVVSSGDKSMVTDAITELVTTLAGVVCDRLEEQGVETEVTAPIPGVPTMRLHDLVSSTLLGGPFGKVVMSVITRDISATAWPV